MIEKPLYMEIRERRGRNAETLLRTEAGEGSVAAPSPEVYSLADLELVVAFEGGSKYFRPDFELTVNDQTISGFQAIHFDNESVLRFKHPLLSTCLDEAFVVLKIGLEEDSPRFEVLVKVTDRPDETDPDRLSLLAIAKYVEEHAAFFLANADIETLLKKAGPGFFSAENRFREIAELYSRSLVYFRTNALFKLSTQELVEPFNRIRSFSASALNYIISHPFELEPGTSSSGILINGNRFTPVHTLVRSKIRNFNVYENRVVLGFLKTVCQAAETELGGSCPELRKRLKELLMVYENSLSIRSEPLFHFPKPTPAITSIDSYRRFYLEMFRWFKEDKKSLERSRFISDARSSGRLYEYYCLLKVLFQLKEDGWELTGHKNIDWRCPAKYYRTVNFSNFFSFEKDGIKRDVFFEPAVHSLDTELCGFLGLYRSTRLKFRAQKTEAEALSQNHTFFTPDFIIRDTFSTGERSFTIADAKYSAPDTVSNYILHEFLLKYGFGIRTVRASDSVQQLLLFCGKDGCSDLLGTTLSFSNPLTQKTDQEVLICQIREDN